MSTTDADLETFDRIAQALGSALVLTGLVLAGLVETFVGNPHTVPGEAGHATTFPPDLRAGLVVAGLLVFALAGLCRLLPVGPGSTAGRGTGTAEA